MERKWELFEERYIVSGKRCFRNRKIGKSEVWERVPRISVAFQNENYISTSGM